MRARWAAHHAAAPAAGGDGAAWLEGAATRAVACDAIVAPGDDRRDGSGRPR